MSDHDPTAPAEPIQDVPPLRTKGPFLAASPKRGRGRPPLKREATPRTAEPRTAEDVSTESTGGIFGTRAAAPSRMPRETGAFEPEYDGPTERMSRTDRDVNQFELPRDLRTKLRNAGWDASYKTIKVLLADVNEVDGTELRAAYSGGWRPAKAKDFPELCLPGTNPEGTIENNGQRLFIRPLSLTRQAQQEDYDFANQQMLSRMQATQAGKSVKSEEEGLADMGRVVRPVAIKLEIEGEVGTYNPR